MASAAVANIKPKRGMVGGDGVTEVAGYFEFNGTSDPTVVKGKGFIVNYTSTGTWTITLSQAYLALISATHGVHLASAANVDLTVQWGAIDVVSAKTLVIRTMAGTSATTAATATGNGLSFKLELSGSKLNA